jgi:hypothetical protein
MIAPISVVVLRLANLNKRMESKSGPTTDPETWPTRWMSSGMTLTLKVLPAHAQSAPHDGSTSVRVERVSERWESSPRLTICRSLAVGVSPKALLA